MRNALFSVILLTFAVILSACGPDIEAVEDEALMEWSQLSVEERQNLCDTYFLFGPTDMEIMLTDGLRSEAEFSGISDEEFSFRMNLLVEIVGEECL